LVVSSGPASSRPIFESGKFRGIHFGRTKKEIKIFSKLDPELRVVEVDRTQIEQVLLNLLVNAWQAMPNGGDIAIVTQNIDLLAGASSRNLLPSRTWHSRSARF